jgi:hypothetical protein
MLELRFVDETVQVDESPGLRRYWEGIPRRFLASSFLALSSLLHGSRVSYMAVQAGGNRDQSTSRSRKIALKGGETKKKSASCSKLCWNAGGTVSG